MLLVVLSALFLVAGGMSLGWWAATEVQAQRDLGEENDSPAAEESQLPTGTIMPDVRGLSEADARQILADVGVDLGSVSVEQRSFAGEAGIVVEQTPAFGSGTGTGVTLGVSSGSVVPEAVGKPAGEVIGTLTGLGAEAVVVERYVAGKEPGSVLALEPKAGEPMPSTVTVTVAEPSSSVFLAELDAVEGRCSRGEQELNGQAFPNSLSCRAGPDPDPEQVSWVVSRAVDRFVATVGVSDAGDPEHGVVVTVLADGEEVASARARYGDPAEIDAPVTGALRLTVTFTSVDEENSADAVLGDARLLGGTEAIEGLGDE